MHKLSLAGAMVVAVFMAASPAMAQAPWLFTGDDDDDDSLFSFGCVELTDHRIRQLVADQGFTNIYLNARNDDYIQVRATQGSWVYLLQVSTCTGSIYGGQQLRPAR